MKPREFKTEKAGREPSETWVEGTRASVEEVERVERGKEEAGEKLRRVPIEVKKEQKSGQQSQPTDDNQDKTVKR